MRNLQRFPIVQSMRALFTFMPLALALAFMIVPSSSFLPHEIQSHVGGLAKAQFIPCETPQPGQPPECAWPEPPIDEPDTDGDGFPDSRDACPTLPAGNKGISSWVGCPTMTEEECEAYAVGGSVVSGVITFIPVIGWVLRVAAGVVSIVVGLSGFRCEQLPSEDLSSYLAGPMG